MTLPWGTQRTDSRRGEHNSPEDGWAGRQTHPRESLAGRFYFICRRRDRTCSRRAEWGENLKTKLRKLNGDRAGSTPNGTMKPPLLRGPEEKRGGGQGGEGS